MRIIVAALLLALCGPLMSAELKAKLSFDRRPTPSGMIYLDGGEGWDAKKVEVTQKGKTFIPRLISAPKGAKVVIKNEDEIKHNVYADDKTSNVKVDLGMSDPLEIVEQKVDWDAGRIVKFGCRIHPEMQLWIASCPTKHNVCFDMEKKDKVTEVSIQDVPAGEQTFVLWLPLYDEMKVTVKPGETQTIDVLRKGKKRGSLELTLSK